MKYRYLGKHGLRISEISLGAWLTFGGSINKEKSKEIITTALDEGINFIDIADIYSKGNAEKIVGEIVSDGTYDRKDLVISSKVFWPMSDNPNDMGLSRKHILDSIEGSLNRLNMDYLDIYYCHRFDHFTPLRETIEAMDDLVRSGQVRYWGTSVWNAAQLERAIGIAKEIGARLPSVEQPRYNMLDRFIELEIIDTAKYHGLGLTVWSPLGQGILTGKYNNGIPEGSRGQTSEFLKRELTDENIEKVKKLSEIASELEITMSQLALAWVLRKDVISSAITGATSVDQLQENIAASDIRLSKEVLEQIESILLNAPDHHPIYRIAVPNR